MSQVKHIVAHRGSLLILVALTACLVLVGCGVSGKPESNASPATSVTSTTGTTLPATTESTLPETTAPETVLPEGGNGDTTIPGDTTPTPDTTNPFGSSEIRRTLIRIYKQSGFTDKEANCVADLIVKQSRNGTFDPSKLDVSKLGAAAQHCFGSDGVPGGSD